MSGDATRRTFRRTWLVAGGAIVAAASAARLAAAARRRRQRLTHGELRELSEMWTWVDGARWYVRMSQIHRADAAVPIVLVHGFGVSSAYFEPLAERLAVTHDVYAPDLPGHGGTDTPSAPLGVGGLAEALAAWLDTMRLERCDLLGHSLGCQIAVELALRRPEIVRRLVLVGPPMDPRARRLRGLLPRFVAGGVGEPFGLTLRLAKDYARMGTRLAPELRAMLSYPLERTLPSTAPVPVLLVRGARDRVATQRWVDELFAASSNVRVVTIPGAAHALHYSHPDALAACVRSFLDGGAPSRAHRGGHSVAGSSRRIVPSGVPLP